ncbi:MAG: hypothetical protein QNJ98_16690 [Planctomycetota bacterium]|nr:hypothetical protein [Planctomycetota bacterium]
MPLKRLAFLLPLLLVLGLLAPLPTGDDLLRTAAAEEEGGENPEDTEPEKGEDLGESTIGFVDEVNEAIERGTQWLYARGETFDISKKMKGAFWGHTLGNAVYGGGQMQAGAWQYSHPAGATALALYTLLKCGIDPKDKRIKAGFNYLREQQVFTKKWHGLPHDFGMRFKHVEIAGSYELSAMILAVTARYDQYKKTSASKSANRKGKLKIRNSADKKFLVELVKALASRRGIPEPGLPEEDRAGWRYNVPHVEMSGGGQTWPRNMGVPPHANQDLSSTQLAALALYSAHRFGVKVKMDVWMDILQFTLSHQESDGPEHERYGRVIENGKQVIKTDHARGFMYIKGSPDHTEGKATSSMTGCGITNLLIARDVLANDPKGQKLWNPRKQLQEDVETAINDGIAWLDKYWSPLENRTADNQKAGYPIYYLYALERAMDVMGKKLCGSHLWYEEGAKSILGLKQAKMIEEKVKGNTELRETLFWRTGTTHEPQDVLDTCFALLFLKRATQGIMPNVTGN